MNVRSTAFRFLIVTSLLGAAVPALAGATRSFVLDSSSVLAEGKLEGTAVTSDGTLVRSVGVKRIELAGVPVARSILVLPSGATYVGTGNEGKVYAVENGAARVLAETKQLMVTALAHDGKDTLFAATMPKGKVFAIDTRASSQPGSKTALREWTLPQGAENIWALVYDAKQKTLYAATGPEGKVFAVDAQGKASVYYDSEASHVMTLAQDDDGTLYAGTGDQALLLRLRGAGRADVVYDFDGNELTAIAVKHGELAVASNLFPKAPAAKAATPSPSGDASSPQASTPQAAPPSTDKAQAGKGRLYRVDKAGNATHLFTTEDGHLTTVEWGADGAIYTGTGREGRVYRVTPDRRSSVWVDVDERQVLATDFSSKKPVLVTGDSGAIYEVLAGPAQKPLWTSKVLDATTLARFGQLSWRSEGKVSLQTRSGNTDKPDASWSDWSSAMTTPGPIRSPAARFLQVRTQLDAQADSVVYAIEAFYLPQNQPAVVSEVSVEPPRAAKGDAKPSATPSTYKLKWKVDNSDGDSLRYRVFSKLEQSRQWRALLRESEVLTANDYNWNTDGVPDGYYRVRVQASDELDNAGSLATQGEGESEPFLIDNHPPSVSALRVEGGQIKGRAQDSLGPIAKLEYSVDGLEWKLLSADDELFDTADEAFTLPVSALPKGNRMIVVRATDARSNTGSAQLEVDVK